ncbi:hypothetical protein [Nocardia aurantia]|uniref:RHIM domain-containing protein n=1 Tax=Nocardia aurantia TaxID=2585199 RepID=A0A7K0DLE8_9NOCA|nr:hypothetical protein [Nocardia aurantia]MQY26603.1 hypothetical protein [Nocardia aurantia]
MEPLTTIVATAIATGAAAGLKDTAKQAISDAYRVVRSLITGRYREVDLTPVEKKPESIAKRDSLAEDLSAAGADEDAELLAAAQKLIAAVRAHEADAAAAIGVDLARIEADALRISDVLSTGSGVRAVDTTVHGSIDISDVRAGVRLPTDPPTAR